MPKNEDGEYELILGNSQLLGVFFIVVVLVGVFFAMGYLVGRNSTAATVSADASPHKPESKPLVVDSSGPPARDTETPVADAGPPKPITTQPQTSEPPRTETPKPVSAPKVVATSEGKPAPGTYLQLTATTQKATAEIMIDVLRNKKFPAVLAEIPESPGTYRVLVGPLTDSEVNQTRTDLQNASLPGKEAIKKTF